MLYISATFSSLSKYREETFSKFDRQLRESRTFNVQMIIESHSVKKTPRQKGRVLVVISENPEGSAGRIATCANFKEECGKSCIHNFSTPTIWQAQ